jgi:hypothetical protein
MLRHHELFFYLRSVGREESSGWFKVLFVSMNLELVRIDCSIWKALSVMLIF